MFGTCYDLIPPGFGLVLAAISVFSLCTRSFDLLAALFFYSFGFGLPIHLCLEVALVKGRQGCNRTEKSHSKMESEVLQNSSPADCDLSCHIRYFKRSMSNHLDHLAGDLQAHSIRGMQKEFTVHQRGETADTAATLHQTLLRSYLSALIAKPGRTPRAFLSRRHLQRQ